MLRIILAGVVVMVASLAVSMPDGSSLSAAEAAQGLNRTLVPRMMEFARASGTPTGPKAPGAVYCFAPVDATGALDFTRARAMGTVTRPMVLAEATVRAANDRHGLTDTNTGSTTVATYAAGTRTDLPFFGRPVTADEFCGLAQGQFKGHGRSDYAWNIW